MLCVILMSEPAKALLSRLEDLLIYDDGLEEKSEAQLIEDHSMEQSITNVKFKEALAIVPQKLVATLALTVLSILEYYFAQCTMTEEGRWLSRDVFLPKSVDFNFF